MEKSRDSSVAAASRACLRSSRKNSIIVAPSSDSGRTSLTSSFNTACPQLSPASLSDTGRVRQAHSSPPRTNVFLVPRAPSALCQSEPGTSTSPRAYGAPVRQNGGPTEFQSPAGPQFSELPIRSFLRAKYGGKILGADSQRFPAACSIGFSPTSQQSQQLQNIFCFESALRGTCSATCPVDGVQASRHAVLPEPRSSTPAAVANASSTNRLPDCSSATPATKAVGEAGETLGSSVNSFKQRLPSRYAYTIRAEGRSPHQTCKYEGIPWKPVVVRDSTSYCVVFKPPFWSCCCCAFNLQVNQQLSSSPDLETELDTPSFDYLSIVHFLQQFFSRLQAPALYDDDVRYGVVYHLDESWSGLLLVAKTVEAFEAFAGQLTEGQIHVKFECLLSTDQNEASTHNCEFHCCRGSSRPAAPPPPQFRLCAPPYYEHTYYSKDGRKLRNEADEEDQENSVQGGEKGSWHHVVLACCLRPAPPVVAAPHFEGHREFPEVTARFWKTRRHVNLGWEEESAEAEAYKWRSFCHGSYLSFYDCDAKGEACNSLTNTVSSLSRNQRSPSEIRPLCTFEAALPCDLKEILTQLQHVNGLPTAQQQLRQQPRQQREVALLAYFRQSLSPEAKLKLLAGCLVVISVGMAANTPWFYRKKLEWSCLQRGISKVFVQALQGLGSVAVGVAAACKSLIFSSASLGNQVQEAGYFVINVLWGGSTDSLTDRAVAA